MIEEYLYFHHQIQFDKIYFKYHDKLNYYVNILEQDSKFEEELLLNNIFEYNYRIEKLLTEQLKFEKYSLFIILSSLESKQDCQFLLQKRFFEYNSRIKAEF